MRARRAVASFALGVAALALLAAGAGCASKGRGKKEEQEIFRRVRPPVAFEMLRDNRDMPLFDLRSEDEFSGPIGHLVGARNLPLEELTTSIQGFENLKRTTFLIYCRGPRAETKRARDVAKRAREAGHDPAAELAVEDALENGPGGSRSGPPPADRGAARTVRDPSSCAERALTLLLGAGFENVMVMDGGIEAWVEMGFGTVGGSAGGIRPRGMPERPLDQGEKPPEG